MIAPAAVACGGGPPARSEVLADLADNAIVPAYTELASSTADLAAATTELCQARTSANLAAAHAALADARINWSYVEPWWIGPVMQRRSWVIIDWPITSDEIEALVSDTTVELDGDRLAYRIGADQRGLGAIEHLLGEPGESSAVLAALSEPRRCQYLTGIAALIAGKASTLLSDWTVDFEATGAYRDIFAAADAGEIDTLVNNAYFVLNAVADRELGVALGDMGGVADVEAIIEGPASLAIADLAAHLDGLETTLIGNDLTPGLGPLLGDDLSERLREHFDAARRAVTQIDPPLRAAVVERADSVSAARDAIGMLKVAVATEVVSRLGVTIGFSDADGDTGS